MGTRVRGSVGTAACKKTNQAGAAKTCFHLLAPFPCGVVLQNDDLLSGLRLYHDGIAVLIVIYHWLHRLHANGHGVSDHLWRSRRMTRSSGPSGQFGLRIENRVAHCAFLIQNGVGIGAGRALEFRRLVCPKRLRDVRVAFHLRGVEKERYVVVWWA